LILEAKPSGGIFNGTGVIGNKFFPKLGNTLNPITYTYIDTNGCKSKIQRFLNATADNDCYNLQGEDFKIIPNPNDGKFEIIYSSDLQSLIQFQTSILSIYDILGSIIYSDIQYGRSGQNENFDIGNKNAGMYFLEINFPYENKVFRKKFFIY
jgi:hypothetical protein